METGQTFVIDKQAVGEMAKFYKRPEGELQKLEGLTFSIAKSKVTSAVTSTEVRGTKWEDGKPKRGRPRKFPRATVARLLGELSDASLTGVEAKVEDSSDDAELEQAADELVGATASDSEVEDDSW